MPINSIKMKVFVLVFISLFCFSCEKTEFETDDFLGTWNFEWQRCENFHLSEFGSINFTMTDSTENVGTVQEMNADTIRTVIFHFSFIGTEKLLIDSLYDPVLGIDWLGTHEITELQAGSFLLERENKSCNNELFKLVK